MSSEPAGPPVDPTEPAAEGEGMGVSNERVGPTGPGQSGTDGGRDVSEATAEPGSDAAPEQSAGGDEPHPDAPIPPVSGYSSRDPRSEDHPFHSDGPPSEAS